MQKETKHKITSRIVFGGAFFGGIAVGVLFNAGQVKAQQRIITDLVKENQKLAYTLGKIFTKKIMKA